MKERKIENKHMNRSELENNMKKIIIGLKKWFKSCESSLVNKTVDENGIGSMFLLKSVYGYTEQQNITVINQIESKEDPQAIAEKYKSVAIPEKPEI